VNLRRTAPWLAAGAGLVLLAALLVAAQPRAVAGLAMRATRGGLAVALGWAAMAALLRGIRLSLVAHGRLRFTSGVAVATAGQLAVGVLPLRLGELALLPLLRSAGVRGTIRGFSLLLLVRVLDVGAVLIWAVGAALLAGRSPYAAAAALLGIAGAVVAVSLGAGRLLRAVALRRRWRPRWRRRALRQSLQVRRELRGLGRTPVRAFACGVLSLLIWLSIWQLSLALLRAMQLDWRPGVVLAAVIGATVAASLPLNVVGSFGTQEAGWVATLAAAGVEPSLALAAGFAAHLWTLAFQTAMGLAGLAYLAVRQPGKAASRSRPRAKILRDSWRGR
jgi:hypothetical protein